MPDLNWTDSELNLDTVPESDNADNDNSDDNQEESTDENDKAAKRQASKDWQVASYQKKLDSWEISGDDVPDWLKDDLNLDEDKDDEPSEEEKIAKLVEDKIEAKLSASKEAESFTAMESNLKALDLSDDEKKILKEEFEDLRSMGLTKTKALEKAMKIANLNDARQQGIELWRMSMPNQGSTPSMTKPTSRLTDMEKQFDTVPRFLQG